MNTSTSTTSTASLSAKSKAFKKAYAVVQASKTPSDLTIFKSIRVMTNHQLSTSNYDVLYVVHKSSMNFKDRVACFSCKTCNSITLIEHCNCSSN